MAAHHRIRILAIVCALCLLVTAAVVVPVTQVFAAAGIWESYIVLNSNYYDVKANTALPDFPASNA